LIFTYEESLDFAPKLSREKFEREQFISRLIIERSQPLIDILEDMIDFEEKEE
jgi:hypothetical protein